MTGKTPVCSSRFKFRNLIVIPSNLEANASELQEDLEEMFPRY